MPDFETNKLAYTILVLFLIPICFRARDSLRKRKQRLDSTTKCGIEDDKLVPPNPDETSDYPGGRPMK